MKEEITWVKLISDIIIVGICPFLILLDLSYAGFKKDIDSVFNWCEKWWVTLYNLPIKKILAQLPEKITQVFNILYGSKHISLKCFYRSVISSFISMIIMGIFINLVDVSGIGAKNIFHHIINSVEELSVRTDINPFIVFFGMVLVNIIIDYFSLLETRFILSRINSRSVFRTFFLGFIDYIITTLLWIIGFALLVNFLNLFAGSNPIPSPFGTNGILDVLFFPFTMAYQWITTGSIIGNKIAGGHLIALFSGSTYFTSILFYIFTISSITLKFAKSLTERIAGLLKYYSEKKFPRPLMLFSFLLAGLTKFAGVVINIIKKI